MTDGLAPRPEIPKLAPAQRRVLGVLLEKAKSTPEYYPMTLKGLVAGCNQKNNREPVVEYSEDYVEETIEGLKRLGFVDAIHPASGRTIKYRHFYRTLHKDFSERQVAVMTELLCRGRQTLGELRTRASRLTPIEDLETLRAELKGLIEVGFVRANGPLEARGVEVDHTYYLPHENVALPEFTARPEAESASGGAMLSSSGATQAEIDRLSAAHESLRQEVVGLRATVEELTERLNKLAADLGVN